MKKLMNRAGLLAAAFALALAVALALNAAGQTPATAQAQTTGVAEVQSATCDPKSHDRDGNGLIDICTPAQLNAMRWDLDGDGTPDEDTPAAAYNVLFAVDDIGCPATSATPATPICKGYELKRDISLDDLPVSWTAIGPWWGAVFDGNGFSITGLRGNNGLFSHIGADAVVKNVDVVDAEITVAAEQGGAVGALAALNLGTIIGCYVTGEITRNATTNYGDIGGLVGRNQKAGQKSGKIYASVADVNITVTAIPIKPTGGRHVMRVGGLVGLNAGAIHGSYAYGNLRDTRTTNDHNAANSGVFKAHGFAVNHGGHGGEIYSSFSYGDKIVINRPSKSKSPAVFASGLNSNSDSCAFREEWHFRSADCITD